VLVGITAGAIGKIMRALAGLRNVLLKLFQRHILYVRREPNIPYATSQYKSWCFRLKNSLSTNGR
jgi:4-alpha-glucanotransferase